METQDEYRRTDRGRRTGRRYYRRNWTNKNELFVKIIFSKYSGTLMGAQVCGAESAGELINTMGLAIQSKLTMTDIATLQYGTHPLLTPAPTTYPLITCALDALHKN
jgi:pyruvate/2-oxoglutarate dehydrogenase complex dihydrolipoamide dehydrogenase (E3) component